MTATILMAGSTARGRRMVEEAKRSVTGAVMASVPAWAAFFVILFSNGVTYLTAVNTGGHDITQFQAHLSSLDTQIQGLAAAVDKLSLGQVQISELTKQVGRLADRLDTSPRQDQLSEINRHLSALDGRLDAYDNRIRANESQLPAINQHLNRLDLEVDNILKLSREPLQAGRR